MFGLFVTLGVVYALGLMITYDEDNHRINWAWPWTLIKKIGQ